jgi:hypothetical protein
VHPADGRIVQLNVSVRRSLVPAKRYRGAVWTRRAHELDLLSDVPAIDHFQSTREELQRPIQRTLTADGGRTEVVAKEVAAVASDLQAKDATAVLTDFLGHVRGAHVDWNGF